MDDNAKKSKFVGDWSELARCWGLPYDEDDDVLARTITDYIKKNLVFVGNGEGAKLNEQIKKDMYDFLDTLIADEEVNGYSTPMFKAMKEIEDDYTFVEWFCNSLRLLWT